MMGAEMDEYLGYEKSERSAMTITVTDKRKQVNSCYDSNDYSLYYGSDSFFRKNISNWEWIRLQF